MMNLEARLIARSTWIVGILLAVVVGNVLFYAMGVANLDKMTRGMKARSLENRKKLAQAEADANSLATDVGRIATGKAFIKTLSAETLKTRAERLVAVQEELAKLLKDSGLAADRIGYKYEIFPLKRTSAKWDHSYLKLGFDLNVNGSYPQVKAFVRNLQNSPHFFVLENITVSSTQQGTVVLRASLEISTYFIATETDRAS